MSKTAVAKDVKWSSLGKSRAMLEYSMKGDMASI